MKYWPRMISVLIVFPYIILFYLALPWSDHFADGIFFPLFWVIFFYSISVLPLIFFGLLIKHMIAGPLKKTQFSLREVLWLLGSWTGVISCVVLIYIAVATGSLGV